MVKQRMGTADVAGEVACLQRLLGFRMANLYDINAKTYMLKLAKSGEDGEKAFLVLESGTRFHTTQFIKEKSDTPSNFTLKLRKHLRTRRLESVRQLGVDRIVDFTFGSGDAAHHLLLELYSQGNVILTDSNYEVLTLLRSHRDDAKGFAIMARHPYPIHTIRLRTPVSEQQLQEALAAADDKSTLKGVLSSIHPYGPAVSDHCILTAKLEPGRLVQAQPLSQEEAIALRAGIRSWEQWLDDCERRPPEGFITLKQAGSNKKDKGGVKPPEPAPAPAAAPVAPSPDQPDAPKTGIVLEDGWFFDEFDPLVMAQRRDCRTIRFDTFDAALDEFFAKIEGQRAEQVRAHQEKAALAKLDRIRTDQGQRAEDLEKEAAEAEAKANLIEYNLEAVDAAINAVREALAAGLDWRELARMIKDERRAGNPVAGLIDSLQLERNKITLLLSNFLDEEEGDDDALTRPATKVEVDLEFNAYANARMHYENRKQRVVKQQKTIDANQKALKAAEKRALLQLSQVKAAPTGQVVRKTLWFEKFNWFISSENFLVISGRDMQQNELLVKRYLRRGDLAAAHHSQAGCACVCLSAAWDAKIVTSAWWVHHHQVSKTAPSREYLPTGSFMVRGRKNFLPPHPLLMGFGFMFKLDDSSLAGHLGERAPRLADDASSMADPAYQASLPEAAEQLDINGGDSGAESGDDGSGNGTGQEDQRGGANTASISGSVDGSAKRLSSANSALDAFMDSAADPLVNQNYSRYGLDAPADRKSGTDAALDDSGEASTAPEAGGSASAADAALELARKQERERREAKQGNSGAAGAKGKPPLPLQQPSAAEKANAAAAAAARGKRGKAKKAKDKYSEQDEEDRQLAMQLLGSAGERKDKADKKEARKVKRDSKRGAADNGAITQPPITSADLERDEPGSSGSDAEEPAQPVAQTADEKAEIAALLAEENIELITEEEREKLTQLDALTGIPRPDDILLHALPVCAPYSALQGYKYKVKLMPGSQRKGKAARQATELLTKGPEVTPREKELIKAVPEMESINAFVAGVKISMPGLQKIKNDARRNKKNKK
ncbi:hypothetical protein WJX72_012021 [[Myrmecia] bisecta]|uniref:Nuclear export mediator factor NEMF n=1 Tax=[Myrmecia] bisecta TaxID=41462 RepID=A0AAW1PAP8_9CHLO